MATMKRSDVVAMWQALQLIGRTPGPISWTFACAATRRALQPTVDSLKEAQTLAPDLQEYQNERIKIAQVLSRPPAPGEVIQPGSIHIDDPEEFTKRIAALQTGKFEGAEEKIIAHFKEVDELLQKTVEVNIVTCPMDKVPELPSQVVDALFEMIAVPVETPKTAPK